MIKFVLGVPGSGKTTYIALKYKEKGWSIYRDTLVTGLTNATIRAFLTKIGENNKKYGARTIHGLAYMELKRNDLLDEDQEKMLDEKYKKEYLMNLGLEMGRRITEKTIENINNLILKAILLYENPFRSWDLVVDIKVYKINKQILRRILNDYRNGKYYDYPFLIFDVIKRGLDMFNIYQMDLSGNVHYNPPERIIIDEVQDAPKRIIDLLLRVKEDKNVELWFVGDPAQEIFNYLCTDVRFILNLSKNKTYLIRSHRFGKNISSLANKILHNIGFSHKIQTSPDKKDLVKILEYKPDNFYTLIYQLYRSDVIKDIAVLTRTKEQARKFFNMLKEKGYPVINLERYEYEKIKQLMFYIELYKREKEKVIQSSSLLDYFSSPLHRFISKLKEEGFERKYLELALKLLKSKKNILVSTIHNVKGLEFDAVVVYDSIPRLIDRLIRMGYVKLEDELKVLYVGVTRAKKVLIVMYDSNNLINTIL